ncbi:hypothetical protein FA15DRAFT_728771 [Coprinopsis marcescibilis]|uniref:CHAT domain-containing protein n=1 Tax=Coprinopsis marcescibilis TaxID=230819 RepID=A0A5C3KFY4_COPMA|nr:hypothetical protein FA15DRAFT_728771 [Coprinopsis marcescibilis]
MGCVWLHIFPTESYEAASGAVAQLQVGRAQPTLLICPELPDTLAELAKIRRHIPAPRNSVDRVDDRASVGSTHGSLDDVPRNSQESIFVHFGCHGQQHPTNALNNCLLLSEGELTMSKIIQSCQASQASLAYLSACQTAKSNAERPDESLTLSATMLFAGFHGLVGTMWSMHDQDAPIVANVFYQYLFRNGTIAPPAPTDAAYALHIAVQRLREQGVHPSRWVPYVHFGI